METQPETAGKPKEILSVETRKALALGCHLMRDKEAQAEVLMFLFRYFPVQEFVRQAFARIDWTDEREIRLYVWCFEWIRHHAPFSTARVGVMLDTAIQKDGFEFSKKTGRLVRLKKENPGG